MQKVSFFRSSIGKKILMAGSGILMCLFLVGHLSGNFLLFVSKEAFNDYADFLNSTRLLIVAEIGLLLILLVHIVTAVQLSKENNTAKPSKYAVKASGGRRSWASSHMLHSGIIILLFIIVHIVTFKFGNWSNETPANTLYDLVVRRFSDWYYSLFYAVSMILLGFHLHHAVKSACITLGIANSSVLRAVTQISAVFALLITLGFISFPGVFFIQSLAR